MNDLSLGLEVLALGFLVVLFALAFLAVILEVFHRLFGDKPEIAPAQPTPTTQTPLTAERTTSTQAERPELVAASIGAILYTMETGGYSRFAIKEVKALSTRRSNWALGGRTNLLDARRDFVSMRRRKKK